MSKKTTIIFPERQSMGPAKTIKLDDYHDFDGTIADSEPTNADNLPISRFSVPNPSFQEHTTAYRFGRNNKVKPHQATLDIINRRRRR